MPKILRSHWQVVERRGHAIQKRHAGCVVLSPFERAFIGMSRSDLARAAVPTRAARRVAFALKKRTIWGGLAVYNRQLAQEGHEQVEFFSREERARDAERGSNSGERRVSTVSEDLCHRNTFVRTRVLHLSAVHAHDYREPR